MIDEGKDKEELREKPFRALAVENNANYQRLFNDAFLMMTGIESVIIEGPDALEILRRAKEEGMPFNVVYANKYVGSMDFLAFAKIAKAESLSQGGVVLFSADPGPYATLPHHLLEKKGVAGVISKEKISSAGDLKVYIEQEKKRQEMPLR